MPFGSCALVVVVGGGDSAATTNCYSVTLFNRVYYESFTHRVRILQFFHLLYCLEEEGVSTRASSVIPVFMLTPVTQGPQLYFAALHL
jgi:hypothetical protein